MWKRWLILCCLLLLAAAGAPRARAGAVVCACGWQNPELRAREKLAADTVWRQNVVRRYALVHPSKAYAGVWVRDSFWTFMAIGDPALSLPALRHFANRQLPSGQVPTQFSNFLRDPLYKPDESTLLFLIWAGWQQEHGGAHLDSAVLHHALGYVRAHVHHGLYQSQAGSYASWFDGFVLPAPDTLSYNQGLYVVAILAAQHLGLGVGDAEVHTGVEGYQSLVDQHGGYLRFSRLLPYHDISGLTGEFLSLWLYNRPLLSNAAVSTTLRTQRRFHAGFRVVTEANGDYLPPQSFVGDFPAGDYQNGGSWLLYDYMALAAGCLHGVAGLGTQLEDRMRLEFVPGTTFHEYLNTNPTSSLYGHEAVIRDTFSWDSFVVQVDSTLSTNACSWLARG